MSNMQLSDSDRDMIRSYTTELLNRRKQLCPLEMSLENLERLYIPSYFYNTMQKLCERDATLSSYIHRENYVEIRLPLNTDLEALRSGKMFMRVKRGLRLIAMSENHGPLTAIKSSPGYRVFAEWSARVVEVELTNRVVSHVIRSVLSAATTYKQLFKALPESMQAVAVQAGVHDKQNDWSYRGQRIKLQNVLEINNKEGASRAKNLPAFTTEMLNRRRTLVEQVLATAVLLPPHDGLGSGSLFQDSWVGGLHLDTAKV